MISLSEPICVVVPSHTKPNHSYTVTFPTNSQPYCECKGYGYRKTCSHIKEAADQLLDNLLSTPSIIRPDGKLRSQWEMDGGYGKCSMCGIALMGTHAFLDKCAACYRHETFSKQEVS